MTNTKSEDGTPIRLNYQLIRNVTSPEEQDNGVATYIANLPAFELELVDTQLNLRDYIPGSDFDALKTGRRNNVHKAIERTIVDEPDRFINRNGGVTITCGAIDVDDKQRVMTLHEPSVINGAQTRGEILRHLQSIREDGDAPSSPFNVRAEIIVDPDHSSVVETSIARNTASPVKSISQAGGRGQLNELDEVIFKVRGVHIRKSETDHDALDTFHVLQAARLMMPSIILPSDSMSETLRPYKQRALCLEDFTNWFLNKDVDEASRERYQFTLDIAPIAIAEFDYWQSGRMFNNKGIRAETGKSKKRSFRRDKKMRGEIVWVSPGIVFPIVGAMRELVVRENGKWQLTRPEIFEEDELVDAAIEQWRSNETDPYMMGRSAGAYAALRLVTRTAKRATDRMKQ